MKNHVAISESVINLIAKSALDGEAGISLIGGVSGVGKTETVHTVIDYIKNSDLLPPDNILYINTIAAREGGDNVYDIASDFLVELPDDSKVLIVLDELLYDDSVKLALMLAQSGVAVLGVVQTDSDVPTKDSGEQAKMSSLLRHAVTKVEDSMKPIRIHSLFNHLKLLIIQDFLTPTHHRSLKLDSNIRGVVYSEVMPELASDNEPVDIQIAVNQKSAAAICNGIDALQVTHH